MIYCSSCSLNVIPMPVFHSSSVVTIFSTNEKSLNNFWTTFILSFYWRNNWICFRLQKERRPVGGDKLVGHFEKSILCHWISWGYSTCSSDTPTNFRESKSYLTRNHSFKILFSFLFTILLSKILDNFHVKFLLTIQLDLFSSSEGTSTRGGGYTCGSFWKINSMSLDILRLFNVFLRHSNQFPGQ